MCAQGENIAPFMYYLLVFICIVDWPRDCRVCSLNRHAKRAQRLYDHPGEEGRSRFAKE
jgi:hypothetical protein